MSEATARGRTIQLFLTDGSPSGLIIATLHGWTGSVMVAHQTTLRALLRREETKRAGVYILHGPDDEENGQPHAYIGEAEEIGQRIQHSAKKQEESWEWRRIVVVTTSDESLTKGHVRYLEARLIQIAKEYGRVALKNAQQPNRPYLPETDKANMERFLEDIRLILPVVGLDLFERDAAARARRPENRHPVTEDAVGVLHPKFTIYNKDGVAATMVEAGNEYVVMKDSTAMKDTRASSMPYARLKERLIREKKLVEENGFYRLTTDVAFQSLSASAAVVIDRNVNGRTQWRLGAETYCDWLKAKTYADWQMEAAERGP